MSDDELTDVRRRIAYLFQGAALFDSLNVGENVAYGLREQFWNKMSDEEIDARVEQSLELGRPPGHPGDAPERPLRRHEEARRPRAHARAPARGHPVRRADDGPGPDQHRPHQPPHRRDPARAQVTSVVVTHDMGTAFTVSDRLAMIGKGRILLVGTKDEFRESQNHRVHNFINGIAPPSEDVASLLSSS